MFGRQLAHALKTLVPWGTALRSTPPSAGGITWTSLTGVEALGLAKEPKRSVTSAARPTPGSHATPPLLTEGVSPALASGLVAWFGASTFGVAALIILGGVTRLTRSGLSMTEWKFTGERPPLTGGDWLTEFEKYKRSPEFHKVNKSISLDEFKFIYWMEYAHRMWGRCLGAIFGLPVFYFLAKKAVTPALGKRIGLLLLMGGTQGLVGWWMVKSGLEESQNETTIPRVSPYRLAAHLSSAFIIYSLLLWTTLSLRRPLPILTSASLLTQRESRRVRSWLMPLSGLVGMTAVSGAFVAGNDAGRSYNTYPKMGEKWIPEEYFAHRLFSTEHLFENTAAVQLHHRVLAVMTGVSSVMLFLKSRHMELHPITRQYLMGLALDLSLFSLLCVELAAVAVGQVTLGIFTLLNYVPTWLGSAHQAGALVLFSLIIGSLHTLRPVRPSFLHTVLSKVGTGFTALSVVSVGTVVTVMNEKAS